MLYYTERIIAENTLEAYGAFRPVSFVDAGTKRARAARDLRCRDRRALAGGPLGGGVAVSEGISLDDVTVAYARHPAVHHLSGAFPKGSMTAIAGPNGAGKSTLVKAIMGELPLSGGAIDRGGTAVGAFGYLPQANEIDRQFPISVADTVMLGAWRHSGAFRAIGPGVAEKARHALKAVGLEGFGHRQIGSLSAGQFQRVLFARLLLQEAEVIILDEPFTSIDARTTHDLLDIVCRWHRDGRTIIAVLHDFELVRTHFPQTLLLAREAIDWGPTELVMSSRNLLRARAMAEDWDESAGVCEHERALAS
jgi:zinc/manganese transport system ATP-binding protein